MRSATATLLDPFELGCDPGLRVETIDMPTEWFNRSPIALLSHVALVVESYESPPWTPEPVDRRWRARGWGDE